MNPNRIFSMIGLAMKAGYVQSGEFCTEKAVKSGNASLVIVSAEASENTKKKFSNMCSYYGVPIYFFGTKEEMGHYIGKEMRASIAITDEGFSKSIITKFDSINETEE